MALIEMNFLSQSLMRTVTVNAVIPADKLILEETQTAQEMQTTRKTQTAPFKTLYLLNGILGNHTDWVSFTNIQRLAEDKNLAVIMPGGENMLYLDCKKRHALYGEYIGRELVEFTRKIFPLSDKREDTFIGGLSMGGYGALRNGLKYSDTFGRIACLSTGMLLYTLKERTDNPPMFFESRSFAEDIFGDFDKVMDSDKNPVWIMKQLRKQGKELPKIYQAIGTEDSLFEANRRLHSELVSEGADITYVEEPGGHDWDFWGRHIKEVVNWLPLSDTEKGINSGNIGNREGSQQKPDSVDTGRTGKGL